MHLDDLPSAVNISRVIDLTVVLERCDYDIRPRMALMFLKWTMKHWSELAEIEPVYVNRWINRQARLPNGAALRLAKVMGISSELLFWGWE